MKSFIISGKSILHLFLIFSFIISSTFLVYLFSVTPVQVSADMGVKQLLSPYELKTWIDNGYLTNDNEKVVILDTGFDITNPPTYDNFPTYNAGHIPGAYYVPPLALYGWGTPRTDGIILIFRMVPKGVVMDQIIQGYGIDKETMIVFTGNDVRQTTRAYWIFRYWGFSKKQLFILNGKANGDQSVWTDAGYELQTEIPPTPIPSSFSVSVWPGNMDMVRASTEEFIMVAEGAIPKTVILDARSELEWKANLVPDVNDTDIFRFRVNNSIWLNWTEFLVGDESGLHVFKSKHDINKMLKYLGIKKYTPYTFCQGLGGSTVSFFIYDAILNRSAKIHDGSSKELGQLGYLQYNGSHIGLPVDSPWRFDLSKYCSIVTYNDPTDVIPPVIVDADSSSANLINEEDKTYYAGP